MANYLFSVEIVSINPSAIDAYIDVDVDIVEISASNLKAAKQQLKDKFNSSSEFFCQSIHRMEYIGKN